MSLLQNFLKTASKKPAATSDSAAPAPDGLASAEARLGRQEAALMETQVKLSAQAQSLEARLASARARWVQARGQGASADGALEARLSSAVPQASIAEELEAAQAARAAAVQQRQDSVKAATALLGALEKNFAALEAQLEQDNRLLERVCAAAKAPSAATVASADDEGSLDKTLIRAVAEVEAQAPAKAAPLPPPVVEQPDKAAPKAPSKPRADPRRAAPRVALVAEVDVHSDTNFFNGFSTDIADGGLFVATCSLLPIGSTVDVNFSLPNGKRIEAKGEVRWVREADERNPDSFPGMGVRFVELSAGAAQAIAGFVAEREPMFFPD